MSLLDEYNASCTLLVRTHQKDGVGGYKTVWTDGITFDAAFEFEDAAEVTIAEQQGVKRTYNIYVDKTLDLDFHDAFRRDNGQVYRVTNPGTDRFTPSFSKLKKRLIEVEKWELPNDTGE